MIVRCPYDKTDSADPTEVRASETLSFLRFAKPYHFEGLMKRNELDIFGNAKVNPSKDSIAWDLDAGRYTVLSAVVVDQHNIDSSRYEKRTSRLKG